MSSITKRGPFFGTLCKNILSKKKWILGKNLNLWMAWVDSILLFAVLMTLPLAHRYGPMSINMQGDKRFWPIIVQPSDSIWHKHSLIQLTFVYLSACGCLVFSTGHHQRPIFIRSEYTKKERNAETHYLRDRFLVLADRAGNDSKKFWELLERTPSKSQ